MNNDLERSREELLRNRALDGTATSSEWEELEGLAGVGPEVWERLALVLKTESLLGADVRLAATIADHVDLPMSPQTTTYLAWKTWLGWAAAILISVSWLVSLGSPAEVHDAEKHSLEDPENAENEDSSAAFDRYLQAGVEEGRILRELPRIVMEARPTKNGDSVEVLYVRRTLERDVVHQFFELGSDDQGRPTPTPMNSAKLISLGSY